MKTRSFVLGAVGISFVGAGLNHFLHPRPYLTMMPPWVPAPEVMNKVAGAAEIAGGLGLLVPALRRPAGIGLLALLTAVFPANVQVARHGWPGVNMPTWALWARLPVQPLLMGIVWWAAVRDATCQQPASAFSPATRARTAAATSGQTA